MSNETSDSKPTAPLRRTPLYALHEAVGAKFAPFAGYTMPIEYGKGIKYEHLHTRAAAGLFDVSHMGQIVVHGETVADDFETLVPSDIRSLAPLHQRYSVLTNDSGGIVDDLMITRLPDRLLVVANAAFKAGDVTHIDERLGPAHTVELLEDRALIALQGPAAAACLGRWDDAVTRLGFMQAGRFQIAGVDCLVHRCGYTGGDGFELSLAAADAPALAAMLLEHDTVEPVGLGARDTLRLEAGLCLAGVDFDPGSTPVEAALEWVIAQKYRGARGCRARFPGAAVILGQLSDGVGQRRVGFASCDRVPVRSDTVVFHGERAVGRVTSGGYGPSLGVPVAMGYVDNEFTATGTELRVVVRGRPHAIRVADLPFVPHAYYRT
jgi:glycine cleavage system T protein (aminomethyltransferase)